jgi:hypothetical protein
MVSFTPRPLYLQRNRPRCPLGRSMAGSQSRSGRCGKEKDLAFSGIRTSALQSIARHCTDWAIPTAIISVSRIILKIYRVSARGLCSALLSNNLFQTLAALPGKSVGFPQSLQAHNRLTPQRWQLPLNSTFLRIYYLLIIPSFHGNESCHMNNK